MEGWNSIKANKNLTVWFHKNRHTVGIYFHLSLNLTGASSQNKLKIEMWSPQFAETEPAIIPLLGLQDYCPYSVKIGVPPFWKICACNETFHMWTAHFHSYDIKTTQWVSACNLSFKSTCCSRHIVDIVVLAQGKPFIVSDRCCGFST